MGPRRLNTNSKIKERSCLIIKIICRSVGGRGRFRQRRARSISKIRTRSLIYDRNSWNSADYFQKMRKLIKYSMDAICRCRLPREREKEQVGDTIKFWGFFFLFETTESNVYPELKGTRDRKARRFPGVDEKKKRERETESERERKKKVSGWWVDRECHQATNNTVVKFLLSRSFNKLFPSSQYFLTPPWKKVF